MTKRRIWAEGDQTVFLRDEDWEGNEWIREFWIPPNGGYVREVEGRNHGTLGKQVCRSLSWSGWTLECKPGELLDLIRREYRRACRERKREEFAW